MRRPYASVWWLILPVCSTVVTGLRLAAVRERSAWSPGVPPGGPTGQAAALHRSVAAARRQLARRAWIKRIGHLRLVKWIDTWSQTGSYHETIILRDSRGSTVARIMGYRVDIEQVRALAGDGIPDVVLRTWDGGAHGAFVYYVYSAGPQPYCLLAYDKNNDEDDPHHWPNFEVRYLDRSGRHKIVTTYDGFAYWCEVPEWETCYAGSARVPVVLGLRHGRYVDVTSECRPWLRRQLARAKQHLRDDLAEAGRSGPVNEYAQGMIEYYSVALLLFDRAPARRMVARLLPPGQRAFFLENCWQIEKVLADRRNRYAYPPVYSSEQAFASEALPPDADDATQTDSGAMPVSRTNP